MSGLEDSSSFMDREAVTQQLVNVVLKDEIDAFVRIDRVLIAH